MPKFIIGGNWKMQITSVEKSVEIAKEIREALNAIESSNVDVFIAPSPNALYQVGKELKGSKLKLAGQNMYFREKGAFTGETSVESLVEAGCEYVLLGHSERRRIFGENNATINQKVKKALEYGLKPVLCIGETAKEKDQGLTEQINRTQLEESLKDIVPEQLPLITIAYEPVWAINNKYLNPDTEIKTATPEEAKNVHDFIRSWLVSQYGAEIGNSIAIQYGGSMKPANCDGLLSISNINGGLIGGASLSAEKFIPIINSAQQK